MSIKVIDASRKRFKTIRQSKLKSKRNFVWKFKEKEIEALVIQKQQPIGVPSNMCSENMHQIYRRTPMPKCDLLNLILYELY